MPTQDSVERNWRPSHRMYAVCPPVYKPMYLTTTVGNFLRPVPLQHHQYYPWNPGKATLQKAMFSTDYGGRGGIRGLWDSYPQTDRHMQSLVSEVFFLKKKPEMNLRTRRSSPHKLGGACFLSEGAHKPHLWASWLGFSDPHLCGRNWGDGIRDTGSWNDPGVVPVFLFSHETNGDECLPQLLCPLRRLKINNTKITRSSVVL